MSLMQGTDNGPIRRSNTVTTLIHRVTLPLVAVDPRHAGDVLFRLLKAVQNVARIPEGRLGSS